MLEQIKEIIYQTIENQTNFNARNIPEIEAQLHNPDPVFLFDEETFQAQIEQSITLVGQNPQGQSVQFQIPIFLIIELIQSGPEDPNTWAIHTFDVFFELPTKEPRRFKYRMQNREDGSLKYVMSDFQELFDE